MQLCVCVCVCVCIGKLCITHNSFEGGDDKVKIDRTDTFETLLDDVISILVHHTVYHVTIQFVDHPSLQSGR